MKYSMKFNIANYSKWLYCFVFAKLWINCLNIKSDVPVNNKSTQITYLKEC